MEGGQGICTWPSNQEEFRQVDGALMGRRHNGVMRPVLRWSNYNGLNIWKCSLEPVPQRP